MKRALTIIALGVAAFGGVGAINTSDAQAADYIDGHCGMKKLDIVFPWKDHYHVRVGPKYPGGNNRCAGIAKRRTGLNMVARLGGTYSPAGAPALGLDWLNYDLTSWNWKGIVVVGGRGAITTSACAGFGASLAAGPMTWGVGWAISAAAAAGCVDSAVALLHSIDDNFRTRK